MNKNYFAKTPPMGWNSYDYYDTTVTEADIKANADYMAENLKKYGYEYVVVDIEWYAEAAGSRRDEYQYIPFGKVEMDGYSRLMPCVHRFPSAADGRGFKPLADYIHSLGLKFGIHIMRGIPRNAAHMGTAIKGTDKSASDIANAYSICPWNPDMYGLDVKKPQAQLYYDSIMELYASWGVDLIKCDDICRYDADTAEQEIIMLQNAIQKTGRSIVLSLSPGPALPEKAWIYEKYANMWRITDDLWDKWEDILNMFNRCEIWQEHVGTGCYPDCDMIPFGHLGKGFGHEWTCNLTYDEQRTLMSLWCIFRSPLMLGCELTLLDDKTKELITNEDILHLTGHSDGARQIKRDSDEVIWASRDEKAGVYYIALFNLSDCERKIEIPDEKVYEIIDIINGSTGGGVINNPISGIMELWDHRSCDKAGGNINAHGACLYRIKID